MKIIPIGKTEIVMSNPMSKHKYFGWPSVARLQNGKIAVVASGFRRRHVCPFGKAVISYSEDEGKTYTLPAPVIDTVLDDRDAGIVPFGEKSVIVTSFNNTIEFQRSKTKRPFDVAYLDLVTPEEEEAVIGSTFRISHDCGVTFGPLYTCPVTSPHGPLELPDGSLLWVGRTFSPSNIHRKGIDGVHAYKINMDGTTELVGKVPNIMDGDVEPLLCEPHAIVLKDGRILTHIRAQAAGTDLFTTYQSESSDGGKTWTEPVRILDRTGGAPAHLMYHSSGALISVYGYRNAPYGVRAMFSFDEGKTWDIDNDVYINGISHDLGYPATIELSDGSLLTVFYARPSEDDFATVIMQQRWTFEKEE